MGNAFKVTATIPPSSERAGEVVSTSLEVQLNGAVLSMQDIDVNLPLFDFTIPKPGGDVSFVLTDIDGSGNATPNVSGPYTVSDTTPPAARGQITIAVEEVDVP